MKICTKCEIKKLEEEFYKDKSRKDELCNKCKNCIKKYQEENAEEIRKQRKEYRLNNPEKIKEYYKNNKEEINRKQKENKEQKKEYDKVYRKENQEEIRKYQKEYKKKNRLKINEYYNKRIKNDPNFRAQECLRKITRKAITSKGGIKSASTEKLLGCTFEYARLYIENLFTEGMSWENYPEWEIDHIRPIASFLDLTDPLQQRECCHYTNLRPLWADDNRNKSSWWNGIKY